MRVVGTAPICSPKMTQLPHLSNNCTSHEHFRIYVCIYIYTYLFAYIYTYGKATQATQQSKIQFSSKSYISLQFGECIHLGFATLFTFPHGHPHDFTVSGPVKPPIPSSQQSPRDGNWSWISHDYPWVSHWSIIQWHNPNASAIIITKWFFFSPMNQPYSTFWVKPCPVAVHLAGGAHGSGETFMEHCPATSG
jgi:hypothetical protein